MKKTIEDFEKLWKKELSIQSTKEPVQWVVITGLEGMLNFNLAMMGITLPYDIKLYKYYPKKGNCYLYISLYNKQDNKKIKVFYKSGNLTYTGYYGTKEICSITIPNSVGENTSKQFKEIIHILNAYERG